MLTDLELKTFNTFGFIILRQEFTEDKMETIINEYNTAIIETRPDLPVSDERSPFLSGLPESPRFYAIAEQLLGKDPIGMPCQIHSFNGNTRWHPDVGIYLSGKFLPGRRHGINVSIYLETLDADSGALRIIPSSDVAPLYTELKELVSEMRNHPDNNQPNEILSLAGYVCKNNPGDVIIYSTACWHSSYGGRDDRPMTSFGYKGYPRTPEQETVLREHYEGLSRKDARRALENETYLQQLQAWHLNTKEHPIRAQWVKAMRKFGYFDLDFEEFRKELETSGLNRG